MAWIERRPSKKARTSDGKRVPMMAYRVAWWDTSGHRKSATFHKLDMAKQFRRDIEHRLDVGTYRDPNLGKHTLELDVPAQDAARPCR